MKEILLYLSMLITIPASDVNYYEGIAYQLNVSLKEVIEQHIICKIGLKGLYEVFECEHWDGLETEHPKYGPMEKE